MLILPLVLGCQPVFVLDKVLLCEDSADFPGLTAHLANGAKDGSFDYEPQEIKATRVTGSYDLATGDFSWVTTYDHTFGLERKWEGFGTAWTDGDLDIVAEVTETTEHSTTVWEHRETRLGCDVSIRRESDSGVVTREDGELADGEYVYEFRWVDGSEFTAEGVMQFNGTFVETLDHDVDGLTASYEASLDEDGLYRRDFTEVFGSDKTEGFVEITWDGEETADFFQRIDGTRYNWEWTKDITGNGEGSYDYSGEHCNVRWVDGECRLRQCTNDSDRGDCPL